MRQPAVLFHLSPLVLGIALSLSGCQSESPDRLPEIARPSTGEEWTIIDPATEQGTGGAPAPVNGSTSLRAGIAWMTDDEVRVPCRYWIELKWDTGAKAYVSIGRLPLSPARPGKMEILLDARPWTIGNEVRATVEPLAADALPGAAPLAKGENFEHAGRDYLKGPQVAAVLKRGVTDLMDASRPIQDLRLTVHDPERGGKVLTAIVKLAEVATAPVCE